VTQRLEGRNSEDVGEKEPPLAFLVRLNATAQDFLTSQGKSELTS
jgi:hypothetical protein